MDDIVKHGGCWVCKTMEVSTLWSMPSSSLSPALQQQAAQLYSVAVWVDCAKKYGR